MNAKGLSDLLAQKSEPRAHKRLIRKKFTFARPSYEGTNGGRSERESRVNRGNTWHVTMKVNIAEAISMERSKLGVGWRFWRVEREGGRMQKSNEESGGNTRPVLSPEDEILTESAWKFVLSLGGRRLADKQRPHPQYRQMLVHPQHLIRSKPPIHGC